MNGITYDTSTPAGLKAARTALNMTQDALGAALGVHWSTVSRWERGEVPLMAALAVECLVRRQIGPYSALEGDWATLGQPSP